MWIKTKRNELVNVDRLCSINYVCETDSAYDYDGCGTYGITDHELYFIADYDCTDMLINAIARGTLFLEVR